MEATLGRCEKGPLDMFPRLFRGVERSIKKLSADKTLKDRDNTFFGQVTTVINNNSNNNNHKHVEYKNNGDTSSNRDDWDYLRVI